MNFKKEKKQKEAVGAGFKPAPTIRMTRSKEDAKGGPLTADIHPDEAANYEKGGWRKAK